MKQFRDQLEWSEKGIQAGMEIAAQHAKYETRIEKASRRMDLEYATDVRVYQINKYENVSLRQRAFTRYWQRYGEEFTVHTSTAYGQNKPELTKWRTDETTAQIFVYMFVSDDGSQVLQHIAVDVRRFCDALDAHDRGDIALTWYPRDNGPGDTTFNAYPVQTFLANGRPDVLLELTDDIWHRIGLRNPKLDVDCPMTNDERIQLWAANPQHHRWLRQGLFDK